MKAVKIIYALNGTLTKLYKSGNVLVLHAHELNPLTRISRTSRNHIMFRLQMWDILQLC